MSDISAAAVAVTETDALVIGAGPVGLFTIFQLGMVRLRCVIVDALEAVGGQLAALYPEKPIYDIPGFPSVLAGDLVEKLSAQAAPFRPDIRLNVTVSSLTRQDDGRWLAGLSDGRAVLAPAVIIAAGAGAFGPNRPPLDGLSAYEGKSVFYLVRQRSDFAGKKVVIAGGGDSAVDWAISLAEVAARVSVVHRRPKFRAAPESEARLKALADAGTIDLVVPYQLHGLQGSDGHLTGVDVATLSGAVKTLDADVLLPFFGLAATLGPIAGWGLEMRGATIPVDPSTQLTSLPGVFAVGDVCSYPGKMKLILQGFSEAAVAAHNACAVVRPGEALHFQHSTSATIPAL